MHAIGQRMAWHGEAWPGLAGSGSEWQGTAGIFLRMTIERVNITSTDEWLASRPDWIGASEVATVVGESAYASAAILYATKKGLRPPQADSGPMRRGRWLENGALEALLEDHPDWQIKRAKVHVRDT